MEADDPPLVTSWAPRAFALFKDELLELEELASLEAKMLESDLAQFKAQTTAEATRLLAQNSGPHKAAGAPPSTTAPVVRRAQKGGKDKNSETNPASVTARRENMIEARTNELIAQYERQPWRRLYQEYQHELEAVRAVVEPVRKRESQEFTFFSTRAPENYSLDDVLDTSRHRGGRGADDGTIPPPSETPLGVVALSTRASSLSSSPSQGRHPSADPLTRSTSGFASRGEGDIAAAAEFVIDAVEFARKYNEALTATYGYKPVLGTDLPAPSASHSAWAEDASRLKAELDHHRPGLDTIPNDFCLQTFPPPGHGTAAPGGSESCKAAPLGPLPPAPGADGSQRPRRVDGSAPQSREAARTDIAADEGGPLTLASLRLPSLAGLAHGRGDSGYGASATSSTVASSSGQARPAVAGSGSQARTVHKSKAAAGAPKAAASKHAGTAPAAAAATDSGAVSVRDRLAKVPKVECSAKDDLVTLRTVSGQEVQHVVRFTNRAPHRMRFKVKPSSHPWLTYTCTQIAPVAGTGTSRSATHSDGSDPVPVETPLSTGGFIEVAVTFNPLNTSAPLVTATLEVGIAREVNARSGEGAQWDFYPVTVRGETALPAFQLLSHGDAAEPASRAEMVARCAFPFTFVLDRKTAHYQLENTGSAAYVTLLSDSDEFLVDPGLPGSTLLAQGDVMNLAITFTPLGEGLCRGHLIVETRETADGPVLAQHPFQLRGEGVVPHVHLHRLDGTLVDTSGHPQWQINPEEGPARITLENTTPGVPKTIHVVVTNDSPVPLPFEWACEANNDHNSSNEVSLDTHSDGDDSHGTLPSHATTLRIEPASGFLAAGAETHFEATVTAHSVFPLLVSWCLYLRGLPSVPTPVSSVHVHSVSSDVLALYERPKLVPSAAAASGGDASLTEALRVDAFADPVGAFKPFLIDQPVAHLDKVFATGFFAVAYPVVPSAVLVPSCLEEAVDCLVHYENVRRVTLKNHSPRTLHFIFDPSFDECKGWCAPSPWRFCTRGTDEPDVQVTFTPRTGTVPPFGSATITVRFAVHTVGPHHLEVSCFIPEIMAYSRQRAPMAPESGNGSRASRGSLETGLVEMNSDAVSAAAQTAALGPCSHTVSLHVTGVGASVHTSTEYLDFGLIEAGHEAEASFTVTNDNPIPITFDLLDPLMREPPRFVFIPPMFRLGAGDSVEVTVYRKGVAAGDAQTFFELCVRDGATIAIETRATVQSATLMLEEAVLDFGTVPENVWQERTLYVTNTSALDAPFTVEMAFVLPTPQIDVEFPAEHMVRAGQTRYAVPVHARFRYRGEPTDEEREAGIGRYRTLLAVRSQRTNRAVLAEVRCEAVERLCVSLEVAVPSGAEPGITALSSEDYVKALLSNEVVEGALSRAADDVADDEVSVLRPYCSPVHLTMTLPDHAPISRETFALHITNHTGCESEYRVQAHRFPSLAVPAKDPELITGGTATHGSIALATAAGTASTRPAFWTTAMNGLEQRERERRVGLSTAQTLLLDGRGCAMMVGDTTDAAVSATAPAAADGPLGPHAALQLPFALLANLPGRYEEMLHVACGDLAPVAIPVSCEVRGCPVLIDPTTSGLTRVDGLDVLVMPSVIASVATSRRAIGVMNRVPRDLNVSVTSFITASAFEVIAVDDDVDAGQVVLTLAPLTAKTQQREHERKGHTYASPAHFFLPALSSKEVIVEYTPSLTLVQEVLAELDDDHNNTPKGKNKSAREKDKVSLGRSAHGGTGAAVAPSSILTSGTTGSSRAISRTGGGGAARQRGPGTGRRAPSVSSSSTVSSSSASDSDTSDDDDDRVRPAASQEVDWHGSLVIEAEVAESAFNDAFLIDEFYFIHADKYPSTRHLRRYDGHGSTTGKGSAGHASQQEGGSGPTWAKSVVRSVPMLDVHKPLRTRPGRVLRQNRVLPPTQAEQLLLDRELHRLGLASSCASPSFGHSGCHEGAGRTAAPARSSPDSESSDNEDDALGVDNTPLLDAAAGEIRPVAELLAEYEERLSLEAYLHARRREVCRESTQHFVPLELRLRARCGVPRLAVQPSASGVFFPPYTPAEPCLRTIRLTNRNSASLFFQLAVSAPENFRVVRAELVPSGVDEDPLIEEDEESKLGIRAIQALKWSDTADQKRAAKMLASGGGGGRQGAAASRSAVVTLSPMAHISSTDTLSPLLTALRSSASGGGGVTNPVYRLRSGDALDVTVEVVNVGPLLRKAETRHAMLRSTNASATVPLSRTTANGNAITTLPTAAAAAPALSLDAILSVHFLQTSVQHPPLFAPSAPPTAVADGTVSAASTKRAARVLTTLDVKPPDFVEQTVPLCMQLTPMVVSSAPSLVWFKPGQTRHDGRPQPSHPQRLTLFNHTKRPVMFQLIAVSSGQSFLTSSRQATSGTTAELTAGRKLHEVTNLPDSLIGEDGKGTLLVDDASPFNVSPLRGVIPAATRGGEPGVAVLHATFTEHSNVRYECAYRVLINGSMSECTFLLRGDSRESEV